MFTLYSTAGVYDPLSESFSASDIEELKICHAGGRREGGDKLQFNVFSGTDNKLVAQVVQKRGELVTSRGASSKVEKENTHYQGLPEDVGPDSEKNWSQRSRKMKRDVLKNAFENKNQ